MYLREQDRERRNSVIRSRLKESASTAWDKCADASRVFLLLRDDARFVELIDHHQGLLSALPALLAQSNDFDRADAVLSLTVARTVLEPVLARVEVLGWLAQAQPEALMTLLKLMTSDNAGQRDDVEPFAFGRASASKGVSAKRSRPL